MHKEEKNHSAQMSRNHNTRRKGENETQRERKRKKNKPELARIHARQSVRGPRKRFGSINGRQGA